MKELQCVCVLGRSSLGGKRVESYISEPASSCLVRPVGTVWLHQQDKCCLGMSI